MVFACFGGAPLFFLVFLVFVDFVVVQGLVARDALICRGPTRGAGKPDGLDEERSGRIAQVEVNYKLRRMHV